MKNNILIIGGGAAGLEAGGLLKKLGYNVILVEEKKELGGHLAQWDRLFPTMEQAHDVLDKLIVNIQGVTVFKETRIDSINILDKSYNVILSNGITILADALLVATGFDLFRAEKKEEYGYGIYEKVITNADLEHYYKTLSDSRIQNPKRIGFVHCVGSRDEKAQNRGCSKVCCATAVKQACEIKKAFPQAEVFCFYMDLRMFGRGWEDLYLKAQKEYGIRFIRGRVSEVSENKERNLIVKAEDTLSSKPLKVTLDLLVLMSGIRPSEGGNHIKRLLSLLSDADGFFSTKDNFYSLQHSNLQGLFFAGTATGPKTLPDTLHEARSAALEIHNYLTEQQL